MEKKISQTLKNESRICGVYLVHLDVLHKYDIQQWWTNLNLYLILRSQIFLGKYLNHLAKSQILIFPQIPNFSSQISKFFMKTNVYLGF